MVCAYDRVNKCEVAIKIIKSRKPFLVQARTEIEILSKILEKDDNDESNIVRLLDQFIYRNHQCLVFELLSFNLYELLKNTKFRGVSLTLIRKFSKNLLKSLEFLSRPDVNIIHCDLKPENIVSLSSIRSSLFYYSSSVTTASPSQCDQDDRLRLLLLPDQEDLHLHSKSFLSLARGTPRSALLPEDRYVVAGLCGG